MTAERFPFNSLKLISRLDDCQRFQALEALYSQSGGMKEVEAFADGFKLGFLLAAAVYGDDSEGTQ